MARKPPNTSSVVIIVALLAAFSLWTLLVFRWEPLAGWDERLLAPALTPNSATAQIAAAFSLLTWPGVQYATICGIAIWALRHRLRRLGIALLLVAGLGWGGGAVAKRLIQRPRPERALDILTTYGFSYPSNHMIAAVACCIAAGATFAVTRQSVRARLGWTLAAVGIVVLVAADRWITGAHYISDLVGGALFGALVASVALVAAGVSVPAPQDLVQELARKKSAAQTAESGPVKRCAVVYNPVRITDYHLFRRRVEYELETRGWQKPLWLETTEDDPGRGQTKRALEEGVDLVLGAGGDGTIRIVCAGLAGSGVPFGLIPAGTGNLLARNVGIPMDEGAALEVAFTGTEKKIDLVKLTADGGDSDHFAVMAGIGIDAVIMASTNPDLKKAVGSAAYFVAAAQNANRPPADATIQLDDQPVLKRRAQVIVVGNVGDLQGNIRLMPDAKADDGLLDVMIASPRTISDLIRMTTRVLTRRGGTDAQLDRLTGHRVTITVDKPDHYQMDGDTIGECSSLVAEVQPGALLLRVPRPASQPSEAHTASEVDEVAAVAVAP